MIRRARRLLAGVLSVCLAASSAGPSFGQALSSRAVPPAPPAALGALPLSPVSLSPVAAATTLAAPLASISAVEGVPAAAPAAFARDAGGVRPGAASLRAISSDEGAAAAAAQAEFFDRAPSKRAWAGAAVVWSLAGPLAASAAAAPAHAAATFTDWGALARGAALLGPLAVAGAWSALKRGARPQPEPLHPPVLPRASHYATNLALGFVGIAAIAALGGPRIDAFYRLVSAHGVGLLHLLGIEGWKNTAASLVLLDFAAWWWHYLSHRYPLLWRLHKVHHSDLDYDFSTTYRTHWAEMAAETLERLALYALVGPTLATMALFEIVNILLSQCQHANVRMPEPWESLVSRVFMTSHKHYIHHSMNPKDYDSNYGVIFSLWDKLFGTFRRYDLDGPDARFPTGIREYPNAQDLTFWKLMWMPFRSSTKV